MFLRYDVPCIIDFWGQAEFLVVFDKIFFFKVFEVSFFEVDFYLSFLHLGSYVDCQWFFSNKLGVIDILFPNFLTAMTLPSPRLNGQPKFIEK